MQSFLQTLSSFFDSESKRKSKAKPVEQEIPTGKQEVVETKQKETFQDQLKKSQEIYKQSILAQNAKNISGTNIFYVVISKLGKGGFGEVYQVKFPNYKFLNLEDKPYALKIIKMKPNSGVERHMQKNLNEKYISSRIQSESGCLQEFLCYYFPTDDVIIDDDKTIYYITDLMDGDLQKLKSKMSSEQRISFVNNYLYPIVKKGLEELHLMGLIHSDIKLQNILYKQTKDGMDIKIGDLGSTCTESFRLENDNQTFETTDPKCKKCKICLNTFAGTYSYVSPIQFEKYILRYYTGKSDSKLWKKEDDWFALAITIINFMSDKNIIDNQYLKNILKAASDNTRSMQDLISIYRKYIIPEFVGFKSNKQILLDYGLKKEIYDFLEEQLNSNIPKTLLLETK
jgi:serine/threonine protein kinase